MPTQQIAFVTGASSGIGRATAALFAAKGFTVVGTYLRNAAAEPGVEMVQLDVTDPSGVDRAVGTVLERHGRIDVLVNNAGYGLFGAVEETTLEEARRQLEVNFWGAVMVTNSVLPSMRKMRRGRIVNVSSMLGLMPIPFHAYYVASKHALEGYTESLAIELAPFNVQAILIEPSYVASHFFKNRVEADCNLDAYRSDRATVLRTMGERLSGGSKPEDIASVIHAAATSESPSVRYPAGMGASFLKATRALLPTSAFDYVVRKSFRLPH